MKKIDALLTWWSGADFSRRVAVITAMGAGIRLIWALLVGTDALSDGTIYQATSRNLALHGEYAVNLGDPFAYWAPGTSFLYALGIKVFGDSLLSFKIVNLIIGIFAIPIYAFLGRRWFGDVTGLLTGTLFAFWPTLIVGTSILASEVHYISVAGAAILAYKPGAGSFWRNSIASGSLFALACLIRPTALLILPILLVCDLIKTPSEWKRLASMGTVAALCMGLLISPWTMRNADVVGGPVLISTNGGTNLWMGNNPESTGGYMPLPPDIVGLGEIEREHILKERAVSFVTSHPLEAMGLVLKKLWLTHQRETWAVAWNRPGITNRFGSFANAPLKGIASIYWLGMFALTLVCAGQFVRKAFQTSSIVSGAMVLISPPLVLWAYNVAVHAIIVGGDRYHMASAPFVAILAASTIAPLINSARLAALINKGTE